MNNGLVGCHVDQSELKYVWANQRTYNCFVLYTDVKSISKKFKKHNFGTRSKFADDMIKYNIIHAF